MLTNTKYIGKWTWGTTRVVRDSRGKKKQIAVPASDAVVTLRPELRIIDDETWNKAQKRLAELKQVYGHKDGQRPRGPRTHHTSVYPTSLLGGLLFCGACGARLVYQTGGSGVYYGCSKHRKGTCKQATRVPREKTEKLLSDFLAGEFKGIPEWMTGVIGMLSVHFKELDTRLPQEIQARTRARDQLIKKITNLTEAIENGSGNSASLSSALSDREARLADINAEIESAERLLGVPAELPEDIWIKEQLGDLAELLRGDVRSAARLLRDIIGQIRVDAVVPPGKKRGYPRLRFRIDAWAVASRVLENDRKFTSDAMQTAAKRDFKSQEICLDVGGPSRMDTYAPKIAEMRRAGVSWRDIGELTGLGTGNAYTAWKRFTDAAKKPGELPGDDSPLQGVGD